MLAWLVTRAADIEEALTNPVFSSSDQWLTTDMDGPARSTVKISLMGVDGAGHRRLRQAIGRPFSARLVEGLWVPIQVLTDHLVDQVAARLAQGDSVDLVHELALPLPLHTICDLMNIPHGHRATIHQLTTRLLAPATGPAEREHALQQLRQHIHTQAQQSAAEADTDGDDTLTADEMADAGILLLIAGFETTAALIASTLLTLLSRPARYRELVRDPSLVAAAVNEVARLEGPVAFGVTRYTSADVTIAGTRIPAGQRVLLSLGAADRDPRRWPQPDEYDPHRSSGRILAFGHGPHYCLGSHLARLQAQTTMATLTRRLPHLELAVPPHTIPRQDGIFHGPARLPVQVSSSRRP
ncbi:cytochrome P450 [Streptomyces sp. NBC_00306]|uniref:cytochrome P450 n=1 Tax=Streptomyces sp. NBC_00306 TaxID=2975708 RepID=UPI002E2A8790|nr:cytochrome P450 [Streptomyces sp. NBC_00306]